MTDLDRLLVSDERVGEYTDARNIYGPEGVTETADKLIDDLINDRRALIERVRLAEARVKEAETDAANVRAQRDGRKRERDAVIARLRAAEEVVEAARTIPLQEDERHIQAVRDAVQRYDEAVKE